MHAGGLGNQGFQVPLRPLVMCRGGLSKGNCPRVNG